MNLIYAPEVDILLKQQVIESEGEDCPRLPYARLGEDLDTGDVKKIWIFPNIEKSFNSIIINDNLSIKPYKYYVTSGEAIRKTDILISDIKEIVNHTIKPNILDKITSLLIDLDEFYNLLLATKGPAKYLELTKCEDGIYNGNICARKNPKKKKDDSANTTESEGEIDD
jgi:hypothetical protein